MTTNPAPLRVLVDSNMIIDWLLTANPGQMRHAHCGVHNEMDC